MVISLLLLAAATPASAQVCTFSNTGINFGSVAASQNTSVQSTGTITVNCTGRSGRAITVCPNIGSGSGGTDSATGTRYMTLGSERIGYNLYQNNGQGQVWGSYFWQYPPRPPSLSLTPGATGTASAQIVLYGRMLQAIVSGGVYSSSFSADAMFDYGYSRRFQCGAAASRRAVQVPFAVQVNNIGDCQITTTPLDFGSLENLNAAVDATNTISVNCSNRVSYSLSLNNGTSGATTPQARKMRSQTSADTVAYGIYTNTARTTPFGANAYSGTGTGTARVFTAYGRIPAQATPTPSSYSDTIIVTVSY